MYKKLFNSFLFLFFLNASQGQQTIGLSTARFFPATITKEVDKNDTIKNQLNGFSYSAHYRRSIGKQTHLSIGLQYQEWHKGLWTYFRYQFDNFEEPYLVGFKYPIQYSEIGVPIQLWVYSRTRPTQVFLRSGFTAKYMQKITEKYKHDLTQNGFSDLRESPDKTLTRFNLSFDLAVGVQVNIQQFHCYLAPKVFINSLKDRITIIAGEDYLRFGYGAELGVLYRLKK